MKRKPAFIEEEDPETGEAVLGTETSASFFLSAEQNRERRRVWRKSASDFVSDSEAVHLGSILNLLKQRQEKDGLLTIVAGVHDDDEKAWKECENSGGKFRLISGKDTVINGENGTYIMREVPVSKEGGDLDCENPDLIVAQRRYGASGSVSLEAYRLIFRGRVDGDRPYIFPKLGDEIPGVGCPDIQYTFRGIRDWHTFVKGAKFASYDSNVSIDITAKDIESGRKIIFDIERNEEVGLDTKPTSGIMISCADFRPLCNETDASREDPSEAYPSPPSKKKKMDEKRRPREVPKFIELKLIGFGQEIENEAVRADLNIKLILKS